MKAHECYHCKQWIPDGVDHDCWTTTEAALTKDLPEDIRDAWERLREVAGDLGDQRIYASHNSIMFSRKACHFFVRPSQKRLELVFFLGRQIKSAMLRKSARSSKTKFWHVVHLIHRDQVEPPLTDWLREAYDLQDVLAAKGPASPRAKKKAKTVKTRGKVKARKSAPRRRQRR